MMMNNVDFQLRIKYSEKIKVEVVFYSEEALKIKRMDAISPDFIREKFKNPSLKVKSVTFYSIIGTQVLDISANSNTAELRLDRLKPGKYLMKYTLSDNTQKVTQIVKQ